MHFAIGQINIDKTDMPQAGTIIPKYTFVDAAGTNFTNTGANFVWDYSSFTATTHSADTFLAVLSTPIAYNFAFNNPFDTLHKATVGSPQAGYVPFPNVTLSNIYNFYKASNTRYSQVGLGASINGLTVPLKYDSPDVCYNFPLHLGDQDSSVSSYSVAIPNFGFFGETKYRQNTVDGWGKLFLPHDTFDVIRITSKLIISDTVFVDNIGFGYRLNHNEIEYKWLAKQMGTPVLKVVNRLGTNSVEYFDTTLYSLGISENQLFNLNVFPNPAQNELFISSSDPIFEIEIVNQTGILQYSTYFKHPKFQNQISIQNFSSGIYFLKVFNKQKQLLKVTKFIKLN